MIENMTVQRNHLSSPLEEFFFHIYMTKPIAKRSAPTRMVPANQASLDVSTDSTGSTGGVSGISLIANHWPHKILG